MADATAKRRTPDLGLFPNGPAASPIIGEYGDLMPVMQRLAMVAPSDAPVLLRGETGTGKEVIARAIHERSPRARAPFLRVNCGAIPPELIDSELFGHEEGSFTGASGQRRGWFERSHGGSLLLDECGELPLQAQVRLLRVLQDGCFERVGGERTISVDVRIIAATHRDLEEMVRTGTFRADLWYRLAVFPIHLPALRERPRDLGEMARRFAEDAARRYGLRPCVPTTEDVALMQQYPWPGNVRELKAVIERAALLGGGKSLDVATSLGFGVRPPRADGLQSEEATPSKFDSLDEAMRKHIHKVLHATRGQIEGHRGAARILGINPHTLRGRMRKLRIEWKQFRGDAEEFRGEGDGI